MKKSNYSLNNTYISLYLTITFLIFYSFVLFLLFPPTTEFLRFIRSFVSLITLPFIMGIKNDVEKAIKITSNVLLLHPFSIYLSILFPSVQVFLAQIFQFVAENRELRYNGLSAGYDISGYLSICGFLICYYTFYASPEKNWIFKALIFYVSVFFTSRTSIVVLLIVTFILFFNFFFRKRFTLKTFFVSIVLISLIVNIVYVYILPNFISTIDIEIFKELSENGNQEAVQTYAKTDPVQMLNDFIILPKNNLGFIFGENSIPLSDSGYIQSINSIGLFGLIFCFFFYIKIYINLNNKKNFNDLTRFLSIVLKFVVLITLVLCIKNQYMFTRGTFELIILLFIIIDLPPNCRLKQLNV